MHDVKIVMVLPLQLSVPANASAQPRHRQRCFTITEPRYRFETRKIAAARILQIVFEFTTKMMPDICGTNLGCYPCISVFLQKINDELRAFSPPQVGITCVLRERVALSW